MSKLSALYQGWVHHQRLAPKAHSFSYPYAMFGLDPVEASGQPHFNWLFGQRWYHLIKFQQKDYIPSEPGEIMQRIAAKVSKLGGQWDGHRALMLVQCRSLGIYFSPINLYYCYDRHNHCRWMLAEVSNTPWNQRHYYLVPMGEVYEQEKAFHVSPFMQMQMRYRWKLNQPAQQLRVQIENHSEQKVFTASMYLQRKPLATGGLAASWLSLPLITIKTLLRIYWQALKLWLKRVPYVPYEKR